MEEFFDALEAAYEVSFPLQPAHITIYTLQPDNGIGIFTEQELEDESFQVKLPELNHIRVVN